MKDLYLYRPSSWEDRGSFLLTPCPPDEWEDHYNDYWGIAFETFPNSPGVRLIWRIAGEGWNFELVTVPDDTLALLDELLDGLLEKLL